MWWSSKSALILAIVCFFVSVVRVNSIWCYQCTSKNPGCDTLTANQTTSVYYKECNQNHTFCRKTTQKILEDDVLRITRSCGWELWKEAKDNCYLNDDDFKHERSCQCFQDGCNGSSTSKYSIVVLFLSCTLFLM